MRPATDGLLRAWVGGLLLLALLPVAHADWARDYDLGVRAAEEGDWAEVERRMRAALAEEPEDAPRKRFQGQRFDRYVPHWYAGLAAYRQGDCARAMDYWNDADGKRVLAGIAELAAEQRRLGGDCQTRLAQAGAPAGEAVAQSPDAGAASAPASRSEPPADTAQQRATPERSVARQPARTPPASPPPRAPATPARAPEPEARSTARVAPPAALREALDAWLAGRYAQLAQVEPAGSLDGRARSQLLLLRAAARFVQAELAGSEAGLDQARADVRAARQAGALSPDQALYPPRFRAFVAATR